MILRTIAKPTEGEQRDDQSPPYRRDVEKLLADKLATPSPDLLRSLLSILVAALMSAEADALCGVGYGECSEGRTNRRNGYHSREFDTRAGAIDVAIPKLRQGSYSPDWLPTRRKRAERALTSVVATCYLLGSVSRIPWYRSAFQVSGVEMAKELDLAVEAFCSRPRDTGPYTFVAADALMFKVRGAGPVIGMHTLIATGVSARDAQVGWPRSARPCPGPPGSGVDPITGST